MPQSSNGHALERPSDGVRQYDLHVDGLGVLIFEPRFSSAGEAALRLLGEMSPALRENLLFHASRACLCLQKLVQRLLNGPAMIRVQFTAGPLQGLLFECWTSEKYLLLGSSYELPVRAVLGQAVRPGGVVYDIGAHAGYWALYASTRCGREGRVFAFEPSPSNFERLRRNTEINERDNITPLALGVADKETQARLSEKGSMSCIVPDASGSSNSCSPIHTVRLDDFVYRDQHAAPGLLKLDVEGFAGRALAGAERVLQCARPWIVCEIHDPGEEAGVLGILAKYSYEVIPMEVSRSFPRHIVAFPPNGAVAGENVAGAAPDNGRARGQ